jgi:hypothetical protein
MEVHHFVNNHLMQHLQVNRIVDERLRSDRPRKTTPGQDKLIARWTWRNRFDTSARIRDELNFGGHVSVRTVNRRLINCHNFIGGFDRIGHVTISVELFLIENESIGQTKVDFYCTPWIAAFESGCIETLHFMTGTWWAHILQSNLNGVAYHDNVLNAHVVPNFDNHPLAERPIIMNDNANPHRARIVRELRQKGTIDTFL